MAAGINDKFKKVSADNSYAVATTVKTARTVGGGTTLEAFDLSKWADATAVNFLTYRKTTDPVTNVTTVTNRTGWTALVNTSSNTLTNLTIAPGYTDLGHQVGDYIEPVQMSKWANDLVDGILVSHNQDGSLKNNAVSTAKIADSSVTAPKIDLTTLNFGNYSTTEQDTGFKWIDGKAIYKRTVNFGTLPNNTYKSVNHGITSIDRFVTIDTIVSDTSGSTHTLNSAFGHTAARESIFVTKTLIGIDTTADRSTFSAYVTMWYTKS